MHLAFFVVAALAAEPTDTAFSFEVASPVVWIAETKDRRLLPVEWRDFFAVRHEGVLPKDGVFQVDGKPVQPEVELVLRGARRSKTSPVTVGDNKDGAFSLRVREPGRYTFKASVGKLWSARMTIEVAILPFKPWMPKADFLEKFGNPDATAPKNRWIYKQWTGLAVYTERDGAVWIERIPAKEWQAYLLDAAAANR
jgi:hypothetical protein